MLDHFARKQQAWMLSNFDLMPATETVDVDLPMFKVASMPLILRANAGEDHPAKPWPHWAHTAQKCCGPVRSGYSWPASGRA